MFTESFYVYSMWATSKQGEYKKNILLTKQPTLTQ